MKRLNIILACGLGIALTGCTTSSQVWGIVNASQNECLENTQKNAASINLLKRTTKASFEKDSDHSALLLELKNQLAETTAALESLQASVEATKAAAKVAPVESTLKDKVVPIQREPILLSEPIKIIAPDTSSPTNATPGK